MSPDPTHIKDLLADPKNRRRHTPRNVGMITDALHSVGAARSIVIDERGEVLAGNGVIEAASDAGITNLKVVDADGQTIVAVRRSGLTAEQKRRLAMFDNRSAEIAEWDVDQLREDLNAGLDLSEFFSDKELDAVLGAEDEIEAAKEIEPLEIDEPSDIVWVLLAIPTAAWPKQLPIVEQLQGAAMFSTSVVRTKRDKPAQDAKRVTQP